ncbi:unnamed protein product [Auanema sp. JU1783]|nr:unnamed protein product [Auanema sp. JU1783]
MSRVASQSPNKKIEEDEDDDIDLFDPSPVKSRLRPASDSPRRPVKRIKLENEHNFEDESPSASSRIKLRRECAEAAIKKITQDGKTEEKDSKNESGDSRECSCERSECPFHKTCCLKRSENCVGSAIDATGKIFHHLSRSEHVCHVCYDVMWKSGTAFSQKFLDWKTDWIEESRCNPGVKAFIMDQILPYWVACTNCEKYRCLQLEHVISSKEISSFTCQNCRTPEEACVADARDFSWIYSIAVSPLLQNNPCLHYLQGGHYFYDEVGLSPVECKYEPLSCQTSEFMYPFNIPEEQSKAFCLRPDVMEYDEVLEFPEHSTEPILYFALRNLIVTLWNINPFKYLTLSDCIPHLICRGLARIWYIKELEKVLKFLSLKNIINYGVLDIPKEIVESQKKQLEVVIVGGGISGLAAARQLRNYGVGVKLLEAKNHIGGRMKDDWSLGVAVGCGAQLVTGSINNPIILMCKQIGVNYRIVDGTCPMIDGQLGNAIDPKVDRLVEEHFDCILDALFTWKSSSSTPRDASLEGKVMATKERVEQPSNFFSFQTTLSLLVATLVVLYFNNAVTVSYVDVIPQAEVLANGDSKFNIIVVTDLDHDSKSTTKKNTWESHAKLGVLKLSKNRKTASVEWKEESEFSVSTQISAGGRAMELSDLCIFNGRLLSVDDRTGIVFEIKDKQAIPWVLLNDGPGNVTKGLKGEWMTVKDRKLYVGGLGKEWTTTTGEYVNDHPMWVKVVSPKGDVEHVNWYENFVNVRKAIGIEYPGYMIHEAVQWSSVHNKWFFLPRRASKETYDETADESRGANVLIEADASFKNFKAHYIGEITHPARGYSAFQFVPGTDDNLILALKSEEKDGKPVASYASVFDVEGKIILEDTPLEGAHKYEGISFF